MSKAYVFEARREGYGIDQLKGVMTVAQLRSFLEGLEDDALVVLSHDSGFTYGRLDTSCTLQESYEDEYGTEWRVVDEIF